MAVKYALIPESEYQRLSGRRTTDMPPQPPAAEPESDIHVYGADHAEDNLLTPLADLMPKPYRSKARLLLHYLAGKVELGEASRVVYSVQMPDGAVRQQTGSHIMDLGMLVV